VGPAIVALSWHALLLAGYIAAFGGDPAALVCVSDDRAGRPPYENIRLAFREPGYDGQFYYALARTPWQKQDQGMDDAPMRQTRILYSAVSFLLSGGDAQRLLWVMPLVNLLAIGGLAALGALVAMRQGMSPWWGVLLPVAVNVAMPALRDLTDVLSTFALCGLLAGWLLRWPWWNLALWALAAALCREQNVAVILVVLLAALWRRQPSISLGMAGVLVLWGGWVLLVRGMYGVWPFHGTGEGHIGLPFAGMIGCLRQINLLPTLASRILQVFGVLLTLAEIGLALYLVRCRVDGVLVLASLGGALLALLGGVILYEGHFGYTRAFALLPLGIWLACVQVRWRWPLAALSASAILPVAAVLKVWVAVA
jgi:hypothetical protein